MARRLFVGLLAFWSAVTMAVVLTSTAQAKPRSGDGSPIVMKSYEYSVPGGTKIQAWYHVGGTDPVGGNPWMVYVHGGRWRWGSHLQSESGFCAAERNRGVDCFSVGFQNAPAATWDTQLADVRAGLAWVRAHVATFNLDPARGVTLGGSSGVLMSTITGLQDGKLAGIIDCGGVSDIGYDYWLSDPGMRAAVLGLMNNKTPSTDPALYRSGQAFHYFSAHHTPTLVMHSLRDSVVPIAMSERYVSKARAAGYPVTYNKINSDIHGLCSQPGNRTILDAWIDQLAPAA